MKLPEDKREEYKELFSQGKISHWEYESKLYRLEKKENEYKEQERKKAERERLRKRRKDREERKYQLELDRQIKELERECAKHKIKRRRILPHIVQKVYERNIKNYGTLTCYLCGCPVRMGDEAIEHKIPVSRGGSNDIDNLDIAHTRCNSKKNTKTVQEYENYRTKR